MEKKLKRKVIRSEGREIITKVYHFLKEEYEMMKEINSDNCDLSPLANIRKRTGKATGVCERTVTRCLHEERVTLSKKSKDEPSTQTEMSDYDTDEDEFTEIKKEKQDLESNIKTEISDQDTDLIDDDFFIKEEEKINDCVLGKKDIVG